MSDDRYKRKEELELRVGTILFTYHRSEHVKRVLEALSKNSLLPEKLYIFQDGIKEGTNVDEWNRVSRIVQNIDWCDTQVHVARENMGLAKSITFGVSYVLEECDAAIILEDDCVPDEHFIKFMVAALETYQSKGEVYSVSGYAWDISLAEDENDAYFNGRACSLGWGTWRDRWSQYEEDYSILKRIKKDSAARRRLSVWGNDLEIMLENKLEGSNDSWAVFWALKVIEKGGYCLSSYQQLIHNIGFDGSGENSGIAPDKYREPDRAFRGEFYFPQTIQSTQECEEEFEFLYGGKRGREKLELYRKLLIKWLQMKQTGRCLQITEKQKQGLAVWGKGEVFECLMREIQLSVKCIVETRPRVETYQGIPIVSIYELPQDIQNVIVIPYFDISIIKRKLEKLRPDICVIGIDELMV